MPRPSRRAERRSEPLTTEHLHEPGTLEASRARAELAAAGAVDKKGADTLLLRVGEVLAIVDWFVVTSGANPRQVRTIAEQVEDRLRREAGARPLRREGLDDARWVLLDYGDVVVHVFLEEVRRFYELERLWGDVPAFPFEVAEVGAAGPVGE